MASVTPLPVGPREVILDRTPAQIPAQQMLDPRHLLGILLRRKYLIAAICLLVTGAAVLYANQLTPLYSARALLVVENNRENVVNIESVVQGARQDFYTNETEAAVIASRELAEKAVDRLDLINNPLFNPDLREARPSPVASLRTIIRDWVLGAPESEGKNVPVEGSLSTAELERQIEEDKEFARQLKEDLVSSYLGGLDATSSTRARVITVSFVSSDPEMAAKAANTTAELYIEDQIANKGDATLRASRWLTERVSELSGRAIESQRRLEMFRRQSGIIEIGGTSVLTKQHSELNSQLIAARARRAEGEARYDQVKELLKTETGTETAAAVLGSPLIQRMREQETEVVRKIAELATQLRSTHPRMILAKNELADLQTKIASEVKKIIINLSNELEIERVREQNLVREVSLLEQRIEKEKDAEATLRTLESEVQANTQLYETLLARLKETSVQEEGAQRADARIISRATVPYSPFYPRKKLLVMAALFFSLVGGIAIAFALEFLDSGFRSLHQLEAMTGVPALSLIPKLPGLKRQNIQAHHHLLDKPNSVFGEAVRSLRTAVMLSDAAHPPKLVGVLSSVPNEGKTSTTLSLAVLAARSGQRVLVLDCDWRHPRVHRYFDMTNTVGMTDYLTGGAPLEDIIELEPLSGVHFIPAGKHVPNPPDLMASDAMKQLLGQLSDMYDLILLDTPPMLAVSDALVLVRLVDKVVFVVRWAHTKRETVIAGLKQAVDAGAHVAGMALTQVDIRKHAQYAYQDAGHYSGHYSKYYVE